LVTGENLGQVASQTIENLDLVNRNCERIVFRPLITYDKRQVIDLARQIGSYDISIRPFDDCCTLFLPKNPTTRGKLHIIEAQEGRLEVDALIAEAIERSERFKLESAL
jgi:thiamine biosynthesis protein ThiI